ncbi:MAG: hypothetical protein JSV62_06215 [Promethearchaeota archaeon]|nr:MAG: hypothetical protein JSV62_06215 [Candidatus Lokiarchaeota archaeon]
MTEEDWEHEEKGIIYFQGYLKMLQTELVKLDAFILTMPPCPAKNNLIEKKKQTKFNIKMAGKAIQILENSIEIKNLEKEYEDLLTKKKEGEYVNLDALEYQLKEKRIKDDELRIQMLERIGEEKKDFIERTGLSNSQKIMNYPFSSEQLIRRQRKLAEMRKKSEKDERKIMVRMYCIVDLIALIITVIVALLILQFIIL